ncbi:MAG: dihydrolipoyl dehydrogenase [Proteobacteria bacterium]|nr:dihydrolipoyl dehydrogenase [Pseudomonadota bacterium]
MSEIKEVLVPDIGDFEAVEVIEVPVNDGDRIQLEDTLITLESDKATIDIPSPYSGTVKNVSTKIGDKVSQGDLILTLEMEIKTAAAEHPATDTDITETTATNVNHESQTDTSVQEQIDMQRGDMHCEVVVLGGGPGGYTAAFRAADLGKQTILIERYETLGGVCLNVGCIPSKALLHIAKVISEISELKEQGLDLGTSNVNIKSVGQYAVNIVNKLTTGLKAMAKQRKVEVVHGTGKFISANMIEVDGAGGKTTISFDHAIIAAGSQPTTIPSFPDDPRIMDSTGALLLDEIPERLLVIGGGVIGLEMAAVYEALGSKITIVEMLDVLISECDKDIIRPLQKRITKLYENIYLSTAVTGIKAAKNHLKVSYDGKKAPKSEQFDAILLSIGRRPNGLKIGAENAGVNVSEQGFIPVDDQQRTNIQNIFAIGDIVGQPMLAHKASHEGKVAAEVISGLKRGFDNRVIPSVAYTDPEVAWVGVTESEAKAKGMNYGKGVFPWAASGRSLSLGRDEGITKVLFDKESNRIIGAAIVGLNAGDLIAECALAIEMGADAEDIGLTIHPHPTLSETIGFAAEIFEGTITDLYIPKRNK